LGKLLAKTAIVGAQPLRELDELRNLFLKRFEIRVHGSNYSLENLGRSTGNIAF
jgi:hypothetical protein